jgi:hypothetical protein
VLNYVRFLLLIQVAMPIERTTENPSKQIWKEFLDLLDQLTLDLDEGKNEEFKELLRGLSVEWMERLMECKNPADILMHLPQRSMNDFTTKEYAMLIFVQMRKIRNAEITASTRSSTKDALRPRHVLDEFDFEDMTMPCTAMMVVYLNEQTMTIGYAEPYIAKSYPNPKEYVYKIFDEHFSFSQPNQLFLFHKGGQWHPIGQNADKFSVSKEDIWHTFNHYKHVKNLRNQEFIN